MAAAAAGAVLLWSGVKGTSVSGSLRSIISGQNPPTGQTRPVTSSFDAAGYDAQGNPTNPSNPSNPSGGGGTRAQNLAIGRLLAAPYGWSSGAEWNALVSLWDSESGWSNTIWNTSASCGGDAFAFGIPQACGHGVRQAIAGHGGVCPFPAGNSGNPPQCGGSNNAAAQIAWGLAYIKANYGSPTRVPHGGY